MTDDLTARARQVVLDALNHENVEVRLRAASLVLARPAPKDSASAKPETAVIQVTIDAETLKEADADRARIGIVTAEPGAADPFTVED
jgi:hypothetical protein